VWRPLWFDISATGHRTDHLYSVVARIAEGVPLEDAKAEFAAYGERIIRQYPENYKDFQYGVSAVSLLEDRVGSVRTPLWILLAAVSLVLLIAVANVTNLMLVRAETRGTELTVRSALGASRPRIARHLLTECLLLSLAGGALGIVLSYLGTRSLLAFAADAVPRSDNVGIDLRVLAVAAAVSIAAGLLAGILPALRTPRRLAEQALGGGTRSVAAGGRSRLRQALVIAEISLAVILVVGSGLMIRTLAELSQVDVGFRVDDVLTTRITLPAAIYPTGPQITTFFAELEERVEALPGVVSAGIVKQVPLINGFGTYSIQIEGREVETIGESPHTYLQLTSPGYFDALDLAAIRGRLHDETDIAGRPLVALVNNAFVREHLEGADPLGGRVRLWGDDTPWLEIVGVVPDIRQRDLERETYPTMYVNHSQLAIDDLPEDAFVLGFARSMGVVIHAERDAAALAGPVREIIREIGPAVPIGDFRTMADIRADETSDREFPAILLMIFSGIALTLAVVGVYGVVAFAASRRTFEMGIRMALGANPSEIRQLVVGHALVPVLLGVLIGIGGAAFTSKGLQGLLYNVGSTDPKTLVTVPVLIVLAAVVASFVPAYRASRIEPSDVLRSE
jgi:predicted permease